MERTLTDITQMTSVAVVAMVIVFIAMAIDLAKWLLTVWVAVGVVLAIGIAKKVYDKVSGRGCAENKDMVCDIIGIIIGAL